MERKNLGEDEIKTIHVLLAILLDKSNIVTISFKHLHLNYEIILEEYDSHNIDISSKHDDSFEMMMKMKMMMFLAHQKLKNQNQI